VFTTPIARAIAALIGRRLCCRISEWTARVGQPGDTFDVAPWNLYNVVWRIGQWAHGRADQP
jgi:hypothetical protein